MTAPILITGGTGTLGSHVVPLLRANGHDDVRILTRTGRAPREGVQYLTGDLLTGDGVARAVEGADTVLHLAGGRKGDDEATRTLLRAASGAAVRHLVHISVIGADRVPLGWFRSKLAAEQAVTDSGVPWTMLRAAQFHDLVLDVLQRMTRLPLIPVPGGLRFQPVDSREVATRLVELALDKPAGRVADLAGPRVYGMGELVRGYLRATGRHRLLMPVRMPGKAGRAYRAGANLSVDQASRGRLTWEDFLDERLAASGGSRTTGPAAARPTKGGTATGE